MPREQFIQGLFWTGKDSSETALSDPIGLDALREEISDELAPCLTGRTRRPEEAFWCLTLLRWARISRPTQIERDFLEWERNLKLVWARFQGDPRTRAPSSFAGSDQAGRQALGPDAPTSAFQPLLADQRYQGMLGQYRSMLQSIELVDGLQLTEVGESWICGSGDPPRLVEGSWQRWRDGFARAAEAYPGFRRRLRLALSAAMPNLYTGLSKLQWRQRCNWLIAASAMGRLGSTARFAHRFCHWADTMRKTFDHLAQDVRGSSARWPAPLNVPKHYGSSGRNRDRWKMVRQYAALSPTKRLEFVIEWHQAEFVGRGYRNVEFWLVRGKYGKGVAARPHNLPRSERNEGSDCRWSNAVNLMRP